MNSEWDDLRVVLGIWRGGSARGASEFLGMSHATIARRIDALETRWGVRIFERLPSGYVLTQDGEELLETAQSMEAEVNNIKLKLTGREQRLEGVIRVTTLDTMASHFLIKVLAEFSKIYPDIEFELVIGYQSLDLRKREADIAIRATAKPPEHLIGQKVATMAWAGFASETYIKRHDFGPGGTARWIGFGARTAKPVWTKNTHHPHMPIWGLFDDVPHQVEAARCALGVAHIPCYVGDVEPNLRRVGEVTTQNDVWLLRHKDTRSTARLRVFSEFLIDAFRREAELFNGELARQP